MTLAGAAQYLKNGITDTMRRDMELLDRLQKIRAELVEVREQLKDVPDGYTVVEVAQAEDEIVIEEPTEEVAPEPTEEVAPVEIEEVIEEIVEPIDDEEDEVEIEELVELIIDEEEEEIIEEELTEEPIEEEPTEESTEESTEEPKEEEPKEEEPTDSTPRPRGAKGGRRSKKQEAKLFEVKPEKQRPIAPFFDQTLF